MVAGLQRGTARALYVLQWDVPGVELAKETMTKQALDRTSALATRGTMNVSGRLAPGRFGSSQCKPERFHLISSSICRTRSW